MTTFRPMTDIERAAARAAGGFKYGRAPFFKRFARSMAAQAEADPPQITDPQAMTLWRLILKHRSQLGQHEAHLCAEARRVTGET